MTNLFPLLIFLILAMCVDYISGMMASKVEAIDHPEDPNYGWSSKKGAKGIMKKVGYIFIIGVALIVDFIVVKTSGTLGLGTPPKIMFGLLVTVWYLLNEILSITENAGRMGTPVPDWLKRYIAVLKDKIEHDDKLD